MRLLLAAIAAIGLYAGSAHAACNNPNPNLLGPPFTDNCKLPAVALNRLTANPLVGALTSPFSADGALFSTATQPGATVPILITEAGGLGPYYDGIRSVVINPAGTITQNTNAIGAYFFNDQAVSPTHGGAVGLFSFGLNRALNGSSWGGNTLMVTKIGPAGQAIYGWELDFLNNNTTDTVLGVIIAGSSPVQPAVAIGVQINSLSVQSPGTAMWTYGFACSDGVISGACQYIGAAATSGSNIGSQFINMGYRDGSGVFQTYATSVDTAGNLNIADSSVASHKVVFSNALSLTIGTSVGVTCAVVSAATMTTKGGIVTHC